MKRTSFRRITTNILLPFCLVLLLSGCTSETPASMDYKASVDGQNIVISFSAGTRSEGTIAADNGVYTFSYSLDGTLNIVYPNGNTYSHRNINGAIASSWDGDVEPEHLGFINGFSLAWAIIEIASRHISTNARGVSPIVSIMLVGLGLFNIILPQKMWWLARGWMYKNVEPSDLVLGVYRGLGVVITLIGIMSFFA